MPWTAIPGLAAVSGIVLIAAGGKAVDMNPRFKPMLVLGVGLLAGAIVFVLVAAWILGG